MIIITIVFAAILIITLTCEYYTFKTGVPTAVSFRSAQNKIIKILQQDLESRPDAQPYVIIDLGSGGGQMTTRIARVLPHAHVIGIEISYFPWLRSVIRRRLFGPKNIEYKRADFWLYDCAGAHAIVTYLTENIIARVSEKLRKELKPGALIVANDVWLSSDWKPIAIEENNILGRFSSKIYTYRR